MGYRPTFFNTRTPDEVWPTLEKHYIKAGHIISKTAESMGVSRSAIMKWLRVNPKHSQKLKAIAKKATEL